jgi:hypothetical protein
MQGVAGESNACYIASIFGQASANGIPVLINSNNKLGIGTSSKRFKEDIKPMGKASEALFALKPVSFRYKKEIDAELTPQFVSWLRTWKGSTPIWSCAMRRAKFTPSGTTSERDVAQRVPQRAP